MVFLPLKICHLWWSLELGYKVWRERVRTCHHQSKNHNHQVQALLLSIMVSYLRSLAMTHDTPDKKTMIASKESESGNHKDGEPVAEEETAESQPELQNEIMIATDAS
jgi:hypothetical protein